MARLLVIPRSAFLRGFGQELLLENHFFGALVALVDRRCRAGGTGGTGVSLLQADEKYEVMASSNRLEGVGVKKVRRVGKEPMVIIGAAMRTLLQICYGVLKKQTPFDALLHPGT